jgi:hypothetical protein
MTYATRLRHKDIAFSFLSHTIEAYVLSISQRCFPVWDFGLDLNLLNDERTLSTKNKPAPLYPAV